MQQFLFIN